MSNQNVAELRKLLKARCSTLSIRQGRGTAWGWCEISGSLQGGTFTDTERQALTDAGLSPGGNFAVISPDSAKWWIAKLNGTLEALAEEHCIGCARPSVERFLCPCDGFHAICAVHKNDASLSIIRRDCANVHEWPDRLTIVA